MWIGTAHVLFRDDRKLGVTRSSGIDHRPNGCNWAETKGSRLIANLNRPENRENRYFTMMLSQARLIKIQRWVEFISSSVDARSRQRDPRCTRCFANSLSRENYIVIWSAIMWHNIRIYKWESCHIFAGNNKLFVSKLKGSSFEYHLVGIGNRWLYWYLIQTDYPSKFDLCRSHDKRFDRRRNCRSIHGADRLELAKMARLLRRKLCGNAGCGRNRAISPLNLMKLSSARCGCKDEKVTSTAIDLTYLRCN